MQELWVHILACPRVSVVCLCDFRPMGDCVFVCVPADTGVTASACSVLEAMHARAQAHVCVCGCCSGACLHTVVLESFVCVVVAC